MNPTFRLISRTAPPLVFLIPSMLYMILYLAWSAGGETKYLWAFATMFIFTSGMLYIYRRIVEADIVGELRDRAGKPIKVLRLGMRNIRFLDKLGFSYFQGKYYPVIVNPKPGRFTFVKYLYMPTVYSSTFSDELLEIAAINQPAYDEITKKIEHYRWSTSYDASNAQKADMVAKSIQNIMK